MADTINTRIALEGAEEIKRQLGDIGKQGDAALGHVSDMVSASNSRWADFSSAVGRVKESFTATGVALAPVAQQFSNMHQRANDLGSSLSNMASNVIPHFKEIMALGAAASVTALYNAAKSAAAGLHEIYKEAKSLGLEVAEFKELIGSFEQTGVSSEAAIRGFGRFSKAIEETVLSQKKASLELGQLAFGSLQVGGVEVIRGVTNAANQSSSIVKASAGRIVDVGSTFTKNSDAIKLAWRGMVDSGATAGRTIDQFVVSVNEMASKSPEAAVKVRELMQRLGEKLPNETIFEKLRDVMPGFKTSIEEAGVKLRDQDGNLRKPLEIFADYLDYFSKIRDSSERAQKAIALFGRGGIEFVPLMEKGRAGLSLYADSWRRLGLDVPRTSKEIEEQGTKLNIAFTLFESAFTKIKNSLGLGFGLAIMPVLDQLTIALYKNGAVLKQWGHDAGEYVASVANDFIALYSDLDAGVVNEWTTSVAKGIKSFKDEVSVAWPTIKAFFIGIVDGLNSLAKMINSVLGTNLNATSLGAIIILGQLSGAFGVIISVAALAGSAIGFFIKVLIAAPAVIASIISGLTSIVRAGALIIAGLSWPVLIVAGLIAAGVAIYVYRDQIWEFLQGAWAGFTATLSGLGELFSAAWGAASRVVFDAFNAFVQKMSDAAAGWSALADWLWGYIKGGWASVVDWIGGGINGLIDWFGKLWDKVKELWGYIKSFFNSPEGDAARNGGMGMMAGGGRVIGAGGPTSDSVPLWGSNGEWMIKAAATSHYGDGFMRSVNNMTFPKVNGFAEGGLIGSVLPATGSRPMLSATAGGGVVEHVRFDLSAGGRTFPGLAGPRQVVNSLLQFAVGERNVSGGPKPSWYTPGATG